jgi:hypothetical protein
MIVCGRGSLLNFVLCVIFVSLVIREFDPGVSYSGYW